MAQRREFGVTATKFFGLHIDCPLCAGSDSVRVGDKDRHGEPLVTDLCRTCGHVFINPQPTEDELGRFYANDYRASYKGVLTPKPKHIYRAGLRALERYRRTHPFLKPHARILDVGSGGGEFTYLMTKVGYTARGLEPNRGYAEFAKSEYAIDIQVGSVLDNLDEDDKWDVITLHHVLEHLADPVSSLRRLSSSLSDEGVLVIEVPNVEARYHGPRQRFHFAHLHTFSSEGLSYAARRAGLSVHDLSLQPQTRHINVVLSKASNQDVNIDSSVAARIEQHLRTDTPTRDFFTTRPYTRLWANMTRPLREYLALRKFTASRNPKAILDQMYVDVAPSSQS
ncbi:MAG: methyltransferase domain-containing protein [Rhodospirillaceae bacterium]|nr:methyltransferase domain-containing protein [Rhodospirillaceae bacterium]